MPTIQINEIDNTKVSATNYNNDNITLVLGTSTFGNPDKPIFIESSDDLNLIGDNTEGSVTVDFIKYITTTGNSQVLFKRFVNDTDTKASNNTFLSVSAEALGDTYTDLNVTTDNSVRFGYLTSEITSESVISKVENTNGNVVITLKDTDNTITKLALNTTEMGIATFSGNTATIELTQFVSALESGPVTKITVTYTDKNGETQTTDLTTKTTTDSSLTLSAKYVGSFGNSFSLGIKKVKTIGSDNDTGDYCYQYYLTVTTSNISKTYNLSTPMLDSYMKTTGNEIIFNSIKDYLETSDYFDSISDNYNGFDFTSIDVNTGSVYPLSGGTDSTRDDYNELINDKFKTYVTNYDTDEDIKDLEDKFLYNFKFITTSGYADNSDLKYIYNGLNKLARTRTDCLAITDTAKGASVEDVINRYTISSYLDINDSYSAVYYPWCYCTVNDSNKWMPPSYLVLYSIYQSYIANGIIYKTPAGVSRGYVGNIVIKPEYEIGGIDLNNLSANESHISINPIMKIRNSGYCIYGIRTAYTVQPPTSNSVIESAFQQVNTRMVINELKHVVFDTCINLSFENNNLTTWNSFISQIEPTFIEMKSEGVISDYSITSGSFTKYSEIRGVINVTVYEAVEDFNIDFIVNAASVSISEETVE